MNRENELQHDTGETHEEWMELCALATTDVLTVEERQRLEEHLAGCAECRVARRQYSALAHVGVPPLAGSYTSDKVDPLPSNQWDNRAARERLLARADHVATTVAEPARQEKRRIKGPHGALAIGSGLAAALVFAIGLSIGWSGGYHLGKRAAEGRQTALISKNAPDVEAEKAALDLRLNEETKRLGELETNSAQREKEISGLQAQLDSANQQAAQSAVDKASEDQTLTAALTDRDTLQNKLHDSQQNYEAVQEQLVALRAQRQQDQLHYASLELEVPDLHTRLHDAEARVTDDTQYLASDRDIRELMGARQLYIADVIDMDLTGHPRKPFGRVFYTKGKSLIFYAFDLDQQPGLRQASTTFQAWAREGSDKARPVSLGIFYVDSEANRRWALKADDPKLLAEINSVFVTVEPKGGSRIPTSKPLLYAYLRTEAPNHP